MTTPIVLIDVCKHFKRGKKGCVLLHLISDFSSTPCFSSFDWLLEKSLGFLRDKSVKKQSLASILHSQLPGPLVVKMVVNISKVKTLVDSTLLQETCQLLPMVVQSPGNSRYRILKNL